MENYPEGCRHPVLKVTRYPFPNASLKKLTATCETILVIEEGQPLIEERLRGPLYDNNKGNGFVRVKGRLDGTLPRTGELNPDLVRIALGMEPLEVFEAPKTTVPRPPALGFTD